MEKENPKAKRRRKGFQQDIRPFTRPPNDNSNSLEKSLSNNNESNRVNKSLNIETNEIDCRNLTSKATGTTVQLDNDREYRVMRVGTAGQNQRA